MFPRAAPSAPNLFGPPPAWILARPRGAYSRIGIEQPLLCRWTILLGGLFTAREGEMMTKNKDLKRLVRSRIEKTDESYTTARLQLVRKKTPRPAPEPHVDYARLAGMSDAAMTAKTGHSWKEWVHILDKVDAAARPHREIAAYVHDNHEISGWWAQAVTVGYERIRGLREIGQRRGGSYEASKSRTFPAPIHAVYQAFATARIRNRWLAGIEMTVRKATPDRSVRIAWSDGTSVEVWLVSKGDSKTQVTVAHTKLATQADVSRMKAFWNEKLGALGRELG